MIASPYDPDVHYAKKRSTTWIGYKVHLTETCDGERPHLITHVETTPAPVVDRDALAPIHGSLATKDLLPAKHLVDAGYMDADQLVAGARDYGVELIRPVPKDNQWQARTEGPSPSKTSLSTGTSRLRPVLPATPAKPGRPTTTRGARLCASTSRQPTATLRAIPALRADCSRRGGERNTQHWKRPGHAKPDRTLPPNTAAVPASRARCHWASAPCTCAGPATLVSPKPTSSTCSRRLPSTMVALATGSQARNATGPASPHSSASWPSPLQPDDFASSIGPLATPLSRLRRHQVPVAPYRAARTQGLRTWAEITGVTVQA